MIEIDEGLVYNIKKQVGRFLMGCRLWAFGCVERETKYIRFEISRRRKRFFRKIFFKWFRKQPYCDNRLLERLQKSTFVWMCT